MTYTSNSLTSANPAADLYTALATALSSAGFTLSDTQVIGTRTHKVWKSPGGSNSFGSDWYLDVAYTTTGAGSIWLGAFEGYSSPNGIRGPYNVTNDTTTPDATTFSRLGATGAPLDQTTWSFGNWSHIVSNMAQIQTTTSAFAYFISATTDRVIALTSVAPTNLVYCGLFTPYTPWANKCGSALFPLVTGTASVPSGTGSGMCPAAVVSSFSSQSAYPCGLTRRPPVATVGNNGSQQGYGTTYLGSAYTDGSGGGASSGGGIGAPVVSVDTASNPFYDAPHGGQIAVFNSWPNTTGGSGGLVLGTLKDCGVFASSAVTRGDTVTVSGVTWVLSNTQSGRCFGFAEI